MPDGVAGDEWTVLIVVGAHLRAEASDRPVAYRLRDRMLAWLAERAGQGAGAGEEAGGEGGPWPIGVAVCTDLWYLNDAALRAMPVVSIGEPSLNALTAFLADKLPSAFVVDDVLMVQLDPEFGDARAACWGVREGATAAAAGAFAERYLDGFMRAAVRAWD